MTFTTLEVKDLKNFLRIDFDDDDAFLEVALNASKGYVQHFTNRSNEELDSIPEIILAVYALVSHFYDVRSFTVEEETINCVIEQILGMHTFYYG